MSYRKRPTHKHVSGSYYQPENTSEVITECQNRCLGGHAGKYPSLEIARKVNVDYTIAAANAWVNSFIPRLSKATKFRFLYVSGIIVERDPDAKLSFLADTRKMKVSILELSSSHYVLA
jgi:hypothetical protein